MDTLFFKPRHWNRIQMPNRHVLVCEDDLDNQILAAGFLRRLFEPQGRVVVSLASGGAAAAGVLGSSDVHLVLLDHDMPFGNGADLLRWMRASMDRAVPVITFSGIPENNQRMMELGATHEFSKSAVLSGQADDVIRSLLA
jgi:CheY-like chemotaxis protein